uniref:Zona pellucida sperm-binding protein 3 n=1 Tax=Eptatretus burgeri TaxID=7764 RepID=A0A8C4R268_EPTBU
MVKIQCGDGAMTLTLNKEFFGTGFWLRETDVTLGPNKCQVTSGDASGALVFHYPLESCGSILSLTSEDMLYTNHLNFEPVIRMGIVRSNSAKLQVLCKYPRKGNASSYDVKPTWIPFYSTKVERSKFAFSLHLMMDDWLEERPSNIYQLGQVMHIEARVHTPNHVNMRLYIDKCVARSSVPGSTTTYSIIENHGCLVDGKVGFDGHLTSRFITRTSNNILQFTLDSFRFSHESTDEVYITCRVKVAESSTSPNNVAKACSYTLASKWQSADGNHMVCSCCESVCARRKRDVALGITSYSLSGYKPLVLNTDHFCGDLMFCRIFNWKIARCPTSKLPTVIDIKSTF